MKSTKQAQDKPYINWYYAKDGSVKYVRYDVKPVTIQTGKLPANIGFSKVA